MNSKKTFFVFALLLFSVSYSYGQLNIDTTSTASQLAQKLAGNGVSVSNAVLNCSPSSSGSFTNGASTQIGIADGIMLTNGFAIQVDSTYSFLADGELGLGGDNDLDSLLYAIGSADTMTFDACVLEFDVYPLGDTLSFNYVFGSEEYEDFTCSNYTDVFAFFISGPKPAGGSYSNQNIALIPGTNLPVAINTVNSGSATGGNLSSDCISTAYSQYFVWDSSICYSGSTIPLIASAAVLPCHSYHLKLSIADVGDHALDSGVFIEGGSLSSNGLPSIKAVLIDGGLSDAVRGCADATITLVSSPPQPAAHTLLFQIGGTAINGTDYTMIADSVVFPANDSVVTVTIDPLNYPGAQSNKTIIISLLSSACGSVPYDSVTITINDSITLVTGPDVSICAGDSVTLSASGTPFCNWHPGSTLSDSLVTSNPVAHPTVTTTYVASYTIGGCSASDSTTVTVRPRPDAGPDDSICPNSTGTLAAVGSGSWQASSANPAVVNITSPNSANTTVTGLSVVGLYSFIWTQSGACSDTANILVSQNAFLSVNNASICLGGDSIILTATPSQGGGTYSWSPGGATTQSITVLPTTMSIYTVTYNLASANCGSTTAYDTVTIISAPTVSVNDITICGGSSGTLTATPSTTGGTYMWAPGGELTQSITVSPTTNTTYTVSYTILNCPVAIDSGTVSLNSQPIPDSITNITCHGLTNGSISVSDPTCTGCTYLWSNSADSAVIRNLAPGVYTVTVTNQNGCISTLSDTLTDPAMATLSIVPNDTTVIENSPVRFTAIFGGYPASSIVSYSWTPSKGLSCTDCPQPIFNTLSGTYDYSLVVTYNQSCPVSDTVRVMVFNQHIIYVPNAFTPNGDGINDVFQIFPKGYVRYVRLTVFDRWGEKVFETDAQGYGWDGTYRGQKAEPGIYTYTLDVTFDDDYSIKNKGSITLIR